MAEHGLKSTRQRSLIIDTFFSLGGHQSVEELWAKVREQAHASLVRLTGEDLGSPDAPGAVEAWRRRYP